MKEAPPYPRKNFDRDRIPFGFCLCFLFGVGMGGTTLPFRCAEAGKPHGFFPYEVCALTWERNVVAVAFAPHDEIAANL